jgi:hypothetical protein
MKIILSVLLSILFISAIAQKTPNTGTYVTSDGLYTMIIRYESNNTVTILEPNKESNYHALGDDVYAYKNPVNGIDYRLRVVDKTNIDCYKPGNPDNITKIAYSGSQHTAFSKAEIDRLKGIEKYYLDKMKEDKDNTQTWAFCAAAAMAHIYYNEEGYKQYATKATRNLKLITVDKTKCPCGDAIPGDIWKNVQ